MTEAHTPDDANHGRGWRGYLLRPLFNGAEKRRRLDIHLKARRHDHFDVTHRHIDFDRRDTRSKPRITWVELEVTAHDART